MQNTYLEMMQETQRLIERANDISATAESVTTLLRLHKGELATMQDMITGRVDAIRKILADDEENYRERFAVLQKELDEAIIKLEGKPPAPAEVASVEVTHAEE